MPQKEKFLELGESLRGSAIPRGHDAFSQACKVYNAMIEKRPDVIAQCQDVADVMHAVRFTNQNRIQPVAIRGGGHSGPGFGVCDNGLVIDLRRMNGVRIDPVAKTARVAGGALLGDVDHASAPFGLALPSGIISTTGVGGLTLGGGHGYLTRSFGLTIDNLISADVVLADGSLIMASEREHPDLFWALRGGGGNFGVVTSFEFQLRPVGEILGGPMLFPMEAAAELLKWFRKFSVEAERHVYCFFAFMTVPPAEMFPQNLHGKKVCGLMWCVAGEETNLREVAVTPGLPKPVFEHVGRMPIAALQCAFDRFYLPGLQWYWKGDFVKEISDEAIEVHLGHGEKLPTPLSSMHIYPINGAAHDRKNSDTAFAYRDANWSMVMTGVDPDPKNADAIRDWSKGYYQAMQPHSMGGGYVNFLMDEAMGRVKSTYRENYERLVDVKNKYDPRNVFHINQNITPDPV